MNKISTAWWLAFVLVGGACGGEDNTELPGLRRVGGTVEGLAGELVLTERGLQELIIDADGSFSFGEALQEGEPYEVAVLAQPHGQRCVIAEGAGTVGGADVVNVAVSCADLPVEPAFALSGTITGLEGGQAVLASGTEAVLVTADGSFGFPSGLADGTAYAVHVLVHPEARFCTVGEASGVIAGADVDDVAVSCLADDTSLAAIGLSDPSEALSPVFDPATSLYTAEVGLLAESVRVMAITSDATATLGVDGHELGSGALSEPVILDLGSTAITLSVTAESGRTESYIVRIDRAAALLTTPTYVKASNTGVDDRFGASIAVSGDTLVLGAPFEDSAATGVDGDRADESAGDSGAAYVFVRRNGAWEQEAYLKASNTGAGDEFGTSVAISGDTIVVGAYREDSGATGVDGNQNDESAPDSGAAYVFVRESGTWSQQAYLKASYTGWYDGFGFSGGISGDMLVVAAPNEGSDSTGINDDESNNDAPGSGAVYVFLRQGATWAQEVYVKPSNTDAFAQFGWSAAISGDRMVIGANREDSGALNGGAAYVFARLGGAWLEESMLHASNAGPEDELGESVAIDGDRVVVGAPNQDGGAADSGAAYVFARQGVWFEEAYLKSASSASGDRFGSGVAIHGDGVLVTAPFEDSAATGAGGSSTSTSNDSGAAHLFRWTGEWWQDGYLKASNTGALDNLGTSAALSGDVAFVGAPAEDSNALGIDGDGSDDSALQSGAVYLFR